MNSQRDFPHILPLSLPQTELKPILIVGAGLSAADAVTICRSSGVNVIHVYRNRSAGLDKMLPETVYPEYHEVSSKSQKFQTSDKKLTNIVAVSGAQNDERLWKHI